MHKLFILENNNHNHILPNTYINIIQIEYMPQSISVCSATFPSSGDWLESSPFSTVSSSGVAGSYIMSSGSGGGGQEEVTRTDCIEHALSLRQDLLVRRV